ncbi:HARB1-like protein [Mya arenaria]|uniref:Putative nuclease HARBI1 n=1 Tax=Mya arenaria TaxID=6604 RepID=A0ABY7FLV2_MYAAR|nr:HARB1-like protein [Mya arenaria]
MKQPGTYSYRRQSFSKASRYNSTLEPLLISYKKQGEGHGHDEENLRPNLDDLTNCEIIDRYRLDRDGIDYVENILSRQITPKAYRNHAISARHKLLISLRYLASGPIQLNDCDIHGVSQPTVSRVLGEMLNVLSDPRLVRQFISFPTDAADLRRNATIFEGIANFPKVMGLIDGTHIRIRAPSEDEYMYVSRKQFHSINVQMVVDGDDKIIDIVARWSGSVHDARILRESGLSQLLDNGFGGHKQFHLMGDSGYHSKRWLLTPYLNPQGLAQEAYNRSHKTTRSRIEKGIGQLKRRFGVLHTPFPRKSLQSWHVLCCTTCVKQEGFHLLTTKVMTMEITTMVIQGHKTKCPVCDTGIILLLHISVDHFKA